MADKRCPKSMKSTLLTLERFDIRLNDTRQKVKKETIALFLEVNSAFCLLELTSKNVAHADDRPSSTPFCTISEHLQKILFKTSLRSTPE